MKVRCASVVVALLFACSRGTDVGPQRASAIVQELYSMTADEPVSLGQTRELEGLYGVTFARRGTQDFQEVFITRDGRKVTERLVDVETERQHLTDDRRFVTCLLQHGVALLADSRAPATQQQLFMLGRFGGKILVHCEVDPDNCRKLGATELPSLSMAGQIHPGLHTREWIETLTACK